MSASVWSVRRARFCFEIQDRRGVDAPLASATKEGVFLRDDLDFSVWNPDSNISNYKLVEPDDFVIGLRSFQHGLSHSAVTGLVSPAYTVLNCRADLYPGFYKHYFRSSILVSQLANITQGIRQGQAIDIESFRNLSVPVPPLEEQRRIANFLDAETSRVDQIIAKRAEWRTLATERVHIALADGLWGSADSEVRLKHLLSRPMSYGANEPGGDVTEGWPRYVRATDISNRGNLRHDTYCSINPSVAQGYLLDDGDLLFVRSGATVGKSLLFRSEWGPAAHAGYLIRARVDGSIVDPALIWYFCQTSKYWEQIAEGSIQATIQNVNAEKFGSIRVPVVAKEKQRKVLDYLNCEYANFVALQDVAERQLVLLAERRQALITAAVTGQFDINTASGRNLTQGV
ncbi:restriction endonuclease subunit S [Nocardia asteroides]|uniref:restriction endonuclease subunit S n=1 Tax=Nocardia asteroides TaxID=1824 RepID=UPI0036540727